VKPRLVLLGFLSHFPVAGVAWQTLHYLVGFQRLGFEVYYVESHGCTPSKLMQSDTDDGPARAAAYIGDLMRRFDLADRWCYHALYESRYFGLSETQLKDLYREAALIINLHGSHLPTPELTATNRLVYLGTDPVDIEIDVYHQKQEAIDYLKPHCAFFSYGENLGRPDCLVPNPGQFQFLPTRQPVVLDFWADHGQRGGDVFTTIGNWRQPWREVHFKGEVYRWSKHFEFLKFIDLPGRVQQPLELALSSYDAADQRMLEAKGWRVRPALDISQDLDAYRRYIGESRGEFTVAKDQNIRLRSGWFSDRAATYLACGRPVITQETGFSNIFPTGEGLFAFSTLDQAAAAIEAINSDYGRQRRAASQIACECFSHEVVLGKLLDDLGISRVVGQASRLPSSPQPSRLPDSPASQTLAGIPDAPGAMSILPPALVLAPTGRWPTRLPEATIQTALALPTPVAVGQPPRRPPSRQPSRLSKEPAGGTPAGTDADGDVRATGASIVIVTFNNLPFTKLCLTSLLTNGWHCGDELILVDNASTDGTPEFLRELARLNPLVRAIFNGQNRGFAAANNQGLALATGDVLILLNNDTLPLRGWRDGLVSWLADASIGLVGPVTNRTCNEAQIDACYHTFGQMEHFAHTYTQQHHGRSTDLSMLAMFCLALRRDVFQRVGPLDEQFEVGMFEDDDYSRRVRQAGLRVVCADDVFVHHFGQASFGELCATGDYDRVLEANRHRFEQKWGVRWQPHPRRITAEYRQLRQRIRETVTARLPAGATVVVVSKGDDALLRFDSQPATLNPQPALKGWHFPQASDGSYANIYPADSAEAINHLEVLRAKGAGYMLIPKPAFWWLDHYADFKHHLDKHYRLAMNDEAACLIYDLRGGSR
jgi:GT2 family glycosyltransferase